MIKRIGHIGVDDRCRVIFLGIVLISPHETITRLLGWPKGLKACVTAKCHRESYENGGS